MEQELLVVALGGNALFLPNETGTPREQRINSERACRDLECLLRPNYSLVFTHGNGPQVGNIVLQNELAASEVPALTLDACVAQSEGSMGFYLQQGMLNALRRRHVRRYVVTLITQVLVNRNDSAFKHPTKPIGSFYSKARAVVLMRERGWKMIDDAKRGWRRVVPSPKPIKVIQRYTIRDMAQIGHIVIAAGGGGIPVVKTQEGIYHGVEAVIDKDLTSAVLASSIKADYFIILTGVPYVYLNFKTPKQRILKNVSAAEMFYFLQEGHFASGSMKPKVEAALLYLNNGGKKTIITDIKNLQAALHGRAGTH
ncbi:MAG: carbamate kinase, partial [Elusimicrobiota bacterium]